MCDSCNCAAPDSASSSLSTEDHYSSDQSINVIKNLLHENDHQASCNRAIFNKRRMLVINLMSSPGSGKTTLLESCIAGLKAKGIQVGVIEGDLETENDANRIRKHQVPVTQITTGMACHLDATMIAKAAEQFATETIDILFIENVGNLVCPASFDLGQHLNVVLLSVTEGDDKPLKYPVMFRKASTVLITKTDLLDYFDDFSVDQASQGILSLSANMKILPLSSRKDIGMERWLVWLENQLASHRRNLKS